MLKPRPLFSAASQSDPEDRGQLAAQVLADLVFYASLNFVGFYIRYVGEINMRRGFLDKRSCIETTFKLKYEKEQEVRLRSCKRALKYYESRLNASLRRLVLNELIFQSLCSPFPFCDGASAAYFSTLIIGLVDVFI